jgi:hypothetical protein
MLVFLFAAAAGASSVVVDERASVSLLQLRSTCMSASMTKHHEDKAAACDTCNTACEQCEISSATCYAGSCNDESGSWCWWYSTTESDSPPAGYTQCSDSTLLLARDTAAQQLLRHEEHLQTKTQVSQQLVRKDDSSETFGGSELSAARTKVLTACFGDNFRAAEDEIGHCFLPHDTHNTCCMMDDDTRRENDKAGNPIGEASVKAWEKINGRSMTDDERATTLTGWCTCFGSTVCGYYAKNSNSRIKFVNDCGCSGEDRYGEGCRRLLFYFFR